MKLIKIFHTFMLITFGKLHIFLYFPYYHSVTHFKIPINRLLYEKNIYFHILSLKTSV